MKRVYTDTIAMLIFSTTTAMVLEIAVAGLTFGQSLTARMVAIPINMLTARPYGIYRDWVVNAAHARNKTARLLADIFAFVTFQIPVYIATLLYSGATTSQIVTACTSLTIASIFMGRPYGVFLEYTRKKLGA